MKVKKYGIINMTIHLVEIQQTEIINKTITWGSHSRTEDRKIRLQPKFVNTVRTNLGNRLGTLRDGVLGKLSRKDQAHRSLDLT